MGLRAGGYVDEDGRVNGGLNLSRALGDHRYKRNAKLPLEAQMISSLPDIVEERLGEDDEFLLLACDGIWNSMTSQQAIQFVRTRLQAGLSVLRICEELCDACMAVGTDGDGSGCDNETVVVVLLDAAKKFPRVLEASAEAIAATEAATAAQGADASSAVSVVGAAVPAEVVSSAEATATSLPGPDWHRDTSL